MNQPMTMETLEELGRAFPSRLVVMLYDDAIASLEAAEAAIARGDIEGRFNATTRTADVIGQLYLSLDMQNGGAIAENLAGVYNYVLTRLPAVNFRNDAAVAREIVRLLRPIRESWFELDERIHAAVADSESDGPQIAGALVASGALAQRNGS